MADIDQHIEDIISKESGVWVSFEYFPPRTEHGVQSLHKLNEKLKRFNPKFIDFTWGAGGSTSNLTFQLCVDTKENLGLVPNLHLTCTNMEHEKIHEALLGCMDKGISNVVALRGDPPAGHIKWEVTEGGFSCALDLVRFIRSEHGSYFNIAVSGYPEGHPDKMSVVDDINSLTPSELTRYSKFLNDNGEEIITVCKDEDFEKEFDYLKLKVDAGANCIITQMFFDVEVFLIFVKKCREKGISVPIIPGIMCIATKPGFERMSRFCKVRVPNSLHEEMVKVQNEHECKELGIRFGTDLCLKLIENGIKGLHFYTLNMGLVTTGILENLQAINILSIPNLANGGEPTIFDHTLQKCALEAHST